MDARDRQQIADAAGGKPLGQIINRLLDAIDPDIKLEKAKALFQTEEPTQEQMGEAAEKLSKEACAPFNNPTLRQLLDDIKKRKEQTIDTVSQDTVLYAGYGPEARERAGAIVDTFKRFIQENKDEITAMEIIYGKPYGSRHVTYREIQELADAIKKPPYQLTPELLWQAYEHLEKSKVKGAGPQKLLTNIVSLVRFAAGQSDVLEPFPETVDKRFDDWLAAQEKAGRTFTPDQREWLLMIKEHIANSLSIGMDDFDYTPFVEKGGAARVYQVFGAELNGILEELNGALVAA